MSGTLFVVSAPSGAGKTSLLANAIPQTTNVEVSISYTTRTPRPSEENGKSYFFITKEKFEAMQSEDKFLESAEVFGNFYGTSYEWVESRLQQDRDVVLEIDWQGALQVKEKFQDAVLIFIFPPSFEHLSSRLRDRDQDSESVQALRLSQARLEMSKYVHFDYVIVNDDFDKATENLLAIFSSARLRLVQQRLRLSAMIESLGAS